MSETGKLFGGPEDGMEFDMTGFWLIRPSEPDDTILADELIVNSFTKGIQPLWQNIPGAAIVPPRLGAPPYQHYKRVHGIPEHHYEYSGLWEWKSYG